MKLLFATSNMNKLREASEILRKIGFEVEHLDIERIEPQHESLEKIAQYSVAFIFDKIERPVFVEDTGLFIKALDGFPGPYSSYVFKTIGNKGILRLMEGIAERGAVFKSVIAFHHDRASKCISADVKGIIAKEERGKLWGYDPIFIPLEGDGRTYAEMGLEEKNKLSHRKRVLEKFANWLKTNFPAR
ncbi:MAG: XTP/dITP diphosphatase [Candidatus Hodarchaeota archaeon]